jgi:hypothetical protein
MMPPRGSNESTVLWALTGCGIAFIYYFQMFNGGWIPHDEGTIAQSAWRVLQGEVPHRDFDAMYTGLLEYMHAGAMRIMGVTLLTPRLVMLGAIAVWITTIWSLAFRIVRSAAAASGLTVLAMLLGPPNYPAAMPSWYNLFLATWGLWALVKWSEKRHWGWLFMAGACGGLSILYKIAGLYFVAGALFFVLHMAASAGPSKEHHPRAPARPFLLFASSAVAALLLLELLLISVNLNLETIVNFALPAACLGGALVWQARSVDDNWSALRETVRGWMAIMAGVAVATAPFLLWYASAGALDDLFRGVFILPQLRLEFANWQVPSIPATVSILGAVALLLIGNRLPRVGQWGLGLAVVVIGSTVVWGMRPETYIRIMRSLQLLVPLSVCLSAGLIASPGEESSARRPVMLAICWTVALHHLIRYPYDAWVYFYYVAPLGVLVAGGVALAIHERWPSTHAVGRVVGGLRLRPVVMGVCLFYAGFLVIGPNRGGVHGPRPVFEMRPLMSERGGLNVPIHEALEYGRMVELVQELSDSEYIYATPDAPDVYFLTEKENPTRRLFEFFDGDANVPEVIEMLREREINVVVVNRAAGFSSIPGGLWDYLAIEYPLLQEVGRYYILTKATEGA